MNPFHLALPVHDLAAARAFYGGHLGCQEARSAERWIDYNFFGHQLSLHLSPDECGHHNSNPVDGDAVPVRHFGVVLDWDHWHELSEKWSQAGIDFIIEPRLRFQGEVGEQATMFLSDPSGNALEFKSFKDRSRLFAK